MISRHWTGLAKKERAGDYISHLQNDTFIKLKELKGFKTARILRRATSEGIEFLIITEWENMDAIKQFAGLNADVAVVPEPVQAMMVKFDSTVRHYEECV